MYNLRHLTSLEKALWPNYNGWYVKQKLKGYVYTRKAFDSYWLPILKDGGKNRRVVKVIIPIGTKVYHGKDYIILPEEFVTKELKACIIRPTL